MISIILIILFAVVIAGCDDVTPLSDKWLKKYHCEYATNYSVYLPLVDQIKANKSLSKYGMSRGPDYQITMICEANGQEKIWEGSSVDFEKGLTNTECIAAYDWFKKLRNYNVVEISSHFEGKEIRIYLKYSMAIAFLSSSAPCKEEYDFWAKEYRKYNYNYCIKLDENVYLIVGNI